MISDAQRKLAYQGGRMAARLGKPLTSCPYRTDQRALSLWFYRGYRSWETRTT